MKNREYDVNSAQGHRENRRSALATTVIVAIISQASPTSLANSPQNTATWPATSCPPPPYDYLATTLAFAWLLSLSMPSSTSHRFSCSPRIHVSRSRARRSGRSLNACMTWAGVPHSGRGSAELAREFLGSLDSRRHEGWRESREAFSSDWAKGQARQG